MQELNIFVFSLLTFSTSNEYTIITKHAKPLRPTTKHDPKGPEYKGPSSMDYREWGSHTRSVHTSQYTSHMRTARLKQEQEAKTKTSAKEQYETREGGR